MKKHFTIVKSVLSNWFLRTFNRAKTYILQAKRDFGSIGITLIALFSIFFTVLFPYVTVGIASCLFFSQIEDPSLACLVTLSMFTLFQVAMLFAAEIMCLLAFCEFCRLFVFIKERYEFHLLEVQNG